MFAPIRRTRTSPASAGASVSEGPSAEVGSVAGGSQEEKASTATRRNDGRGQVIGRAGEYATARRRARSGAGHFETFVCHVTFGIRHQVERLDLAPRLAPVVDAVEADLVAAGGQGVAGLRGAADGLAVDENLRRAVGVEVEVGGVRARGRRRGGGRDRLGARRLRGGRRTGRGVCG